jgi:NADH dehydrogenase
MADTAKDPGERASWLTFALVGAGPTGVELAGQIRELATKTLRAEYRTIMPEDARVLLFDGGSAPLASFGPKLSQRAATILQSLGVEQHMGTRVTRVEPGGIEVQDHAGHTTRYDARTVLWTAGVEAPDVAGALARATGAEQDKAGRILVRPDLTIFGHPEIFVAGDVMSLDKLPGVAEVAMQSGMYAGRRIKRRAAGEPESGPDWAEVKPFRYRDLGTAAYISRGRAVVQAGPLQTGGFIGWWIWLFIHVAFLTGYRNRVGAILTWWLAFTKDSRKERAFTVQDVRNFTDTYTHPLGAPGPDDPQPSPSPAVSDPRSSGPAH